MACDERCRSARGNTCQCECHGKNHGKNYGRYWRDGYTLFDAKYIPKKKRVLKDEKEQFHLLLDNGGEG